MRFRITYTDGPMGNEYAHRDIEAKDMDDAMSKAYRYPEAKSSRFTDFTVEEIVAGPKVIGICYNYTYADSGKTYQNYTFIRANDEAQAVEFYKKNIKGKRFYQPWPNKIDPKGNCIYGSVNYTYFAGGDEFAYDAIENNKTQEETA